MKKVFIFITILSLVGQFFVLVIPVKAAYGTISANPSYFDGNSGDGPFTSYITWTSGGFDQVSGAVVYVSVNGGEETLFSYQNSCIGTNCAANWIYPEETQQVYEFRLYEYNSFTGWVGDLLDIARVVVSPRQNNSTPTNPSNPTTPTNPTNPTTPTNPNPITYNPQLSINKTQFYNTDTWTLRLTGAPANQPTYICAIDNRGVESCTPTGNLGLPSYTDSSGNWTASGNWRGDESVLGTWIEWMYAGGTLSNGQVTEGSRSNNVTFTITRAPQTCQGSPTLVITPANASVNKNNTQSFQALYDPDGPGCPKPEQNVTNQTNWQSLNTLVAQYVSAGTFRGINQGSAQIKAIYQSIIAYANLTVIDNTSGGQAPLVVTQQATNITRNSALLNGLVNANNDYTSYRFEYGTNSSNLNYYTSFGALGGSSNQSVSAIINNLMPNTTYYFRIYAYNNYGEVRGQILSFTTLEDNALNNQPPTVQTLFATGISENSATLNGKVNPNNSPTQYRFEYGTTYSLGNVTSWQSAGSSIEINAYQTLYNLLPNTTYYFRIVAQNQYGTVRGQILSFTTDYIQHGSVPQVITDSATNISQNSAILNGKVNPNNSQTSYYFEYGQNSNFGFTTGFQSAVSGNSQISVSAYISGLNPNTTYYYRLVAQNNYGISYGSIYSFTTNSSGGWWPSGNMPQVITQSANNIYQNYATLNAQVNPNGAGTQAWFEYGTNSNYLSYTTAYSNVGSGNYYYNTSQTVYNLLPNTTYYFRAVARNQYGINYGQILSFNTSGNYNYNQGSAPIVRTTPTTYITQNSALLNGYVNPNNGLTSAWIEYGPNTSLGLRTTILPMGAGNYELPYSFAVSGLLPNTIYYFRIVAQNQYGTSYGQILSFQTLSYQTITTTTYTPTVIQTPPTQVITYQISGTSTKPADYGKQIDCLTIIPSINGKTLDPGNEFTYITTIRNNCNFTLENSVLRVVLPQETDFISTSFPAYSLENNTVVLNLGKIDANVQTAVNVIGRIKSNSKNGDHLVFTSILNFNYRNYSYMINTYLTAVIGQELGGGFAATLKTLGGIFSNWIFWLIVILGGFLWMIYFLINRKFAKEEKYDLSNLKVKREA